jgi:hypothetical protein
LRNYSRRSELRTDRSTNLPGHAAGLHELCAHCETLCRPRCTYRVLQSALDVLRGNFHQ